MRSNGASVRWVFIGDLVLFWLGCTSKTQQGHRFVNFCLFFKRQQNLKTDCGYGVFNVTQSRIFGPLGPPVHVEPTSGSLNPTITPVI